MRLTARVTVAVVFVVSACGGTETAAPETTAAPDEPTTVTTAAPTTTAAAAEATTTTAEPATTTTTEPAVTFGALSPAQQELLDRICQAAADPDSRNLVGEVTILQVLTGESGVKALEESWTDIGQDPDLWDERLAAAALICDEIGWAPLESAAPTTQVPLVATVTVEIGELSLVGETEGCPSDVMLAGDQWFGPNRERWTDSNGAEWEVSLSVDATSQDLAWSFSFSDGTHRLSSFHEIQSAFDAEFAPDGAIFSTIFSDSLAEVSGGWPDTTGTVTINCAAEV